MNFFRFFILVGEYKSSSIVRNCAQALLPTWHHFAALAPKLQDFVVPNERCTSQWHCVLVQTSRWSKVAKGWAPGGNMGWRSCGFLVWGDGMLIGLVCTVLYIVWVWKRLGPFASWPVGGWCLETLSESVCFWGCFGRHWEWDVFNLRYLYNWNDLIFVLRKRRWRVKSQGASSTNWKLQVCDVKSP